MTMTNEEIVREFRQAKFPLKQISIIADQNQCTRREIAEILLAAGETVPKQFLPRQPRSELEPSLPPAPEGAGEYQDENEKEEKSMEERIARAAVDAIARCLKESDQTATSEAAALDFREQVRGVLCVTKEIMDGAQE